MIPQLSSRQSLLPLLPLSLPWQSASDPPNTYRHFVLDLKTASDPPNTYRSTETLYLTVYHYLIATGILVIEFLLVITCDMISVVDIIMI